MANTNGFSFCLAQQLLASLASYSFKVTRMGFWPSLSHVRLALDDCHQISVDHREYCLHKFARPFTPVSDYNGIITK